MSSNPFEYRRINVVGTSGCGKTTFARALSESFSIPHLELDAVFWQPNWEHLSDEDFCSVIQQKLDRESWIIDGNYLHYTHVTWQNVECVIWLDYSFSRTLTQAVGRALRRTITREEIWPGTGNRESFRRSFLSRDSVVLWTIQTWKKYRKRYESIMHEPQYEHIHFIRLRSRTESAEFLESISADLQN